LGNLEAAAVSPPTPLAFFSVPGRRLQLFLPPLTLVGSLLSCLFFSVLLRLRSRSLIRLSLPWFVTSLFQKCSTQKEGGHEFDVADGESGSDLEPASLSGSGDAASCDRMGKWQGSRSRPTARRAAVPLAAPVSRWGVADAFRQPVPKHFGSGLGRGARSFA
jgi:hypothetical protein